MAEQPRLLKKFYELVDVQAQDGGFAVLLDGKVVKSPARNSLLLPTEDLANVIAEEWRSQGDDIDLVNMPITRMSFGAIDLSDSEAQNLRDNIVGYVGTDMLCYHDGDNPDLKERQLVVWQPWLDWAGKMYSLNLQVTDGIMPIDQPEEAGELVAKQLATLGPWQLVPLGLLVGVTGSYVLGEAVRVGALSSAEAVGAAFLDSDFQAEKWGVDEETQRQQQLAAKDIHVAAKFCQQTLSL